MSADGDILQRWCSNAPQDVTAALARLEAAEAQRDALAEALRWYAKPIGENDEGGSRTDFGLRARAALAEAGLEESTTRHGLLIDSERRKQT